MSGYGVSAAALIDVMAKQRPWARETLSRLAKAVVSGEMGMKAFCQAVAKEVGGTALFDAVLALRGGAKGEAARGAGEALALIDHCRDCRSAACAVRGCGALRHMYATLAAHHDNCSRHECETCARWCRVRDEKRTCTLVRATPAAATAPLPVAHAVRRAAMPEADQPPLLATRIPQPRPEKAKRGEQRHEISPALLMLARSALGEIAPNTTSPSNSPAPSPHNSPKRLRKKPKTVGATRAVGASSAGVWGAAHRVPSAG